MRNLIKAFEHLLHAMEGTLIEIIRFIFQLIRGAGSFAILIAMMIIGLFVIHGLLIGFLVLAALFYINYSMPNLKYRLNRFLSRFKK